MMEKSYLPYDDYIKDWLVSATTLRNEDEYLELHKEEILSYRNNLMLEKQKKYKSYEQQRAEKRKNRMSKLRKLYGLHTPSSNYFGKAVKSPPKENARPPNNNINVNNNDNYRKTSNNKYKNNRPLSPIFLNADKATWEPKRSRTPDRFGYDENEDYGQYRNKDEDGEERGVNPPMIFNIHEFNDGYTNKLGVKQKEVLRKGIITETIHETIDGTNKMEDKNFQEKGPLGPPSPPPNVIPRIPSPSPIKVREKWINTESTPSPNGNNNNNNNNNVNELTPATSNLDTSGENLEMEVDELLDWVDALDEQNL